MPIATGPQIAKAYGISRQLADEIVRVSGRLGIPHAAMLANVIAVETGGTFSPSVSHSGSGAVGLIQFVPSTASELGTTTAALGRMGAIEQMRYVESYFNLPRVRQGCPEPWQGRSKAPLSGCNLSWLPFRNQLDVYAAVFNVPNRRDAGLRLRGLASALNVAQSGKEYAESAKSWLKAHYGKSFPYLEPVGRIVPAAAAGTVAALLLGSAFFYWTTLRRRGR